MSGHLILFYDQNGLLKKTSKSTKTYLTTWILTWENWRCLWKSHARRSAFEQDASTCALERDYSSHWKAMSGSYLPLVQLLWRCWPQADKTVVLDYGAGTLAWRRETLHLGHIIQALLDVAKITGFGWRLFIWVRVSAIITLLIFTGPATQAALQAPTLLSQLYLTLWKIQNTALRMGWNWETAKKKKRRIEGAELKKNERTQENWCTNKRW